MEKNQDQVIEQTVNRIVELFHPSRVIEYNTKYCLLYTSDAADEL